MKVTVIGHWGAYPEKGEATSGYLVEHEGFSLLIDCGSGVLSQLQRFVSIEKVNAVLLSHYHHDHIADIGPLTYARLTLTQLGKVSTPLPIYGHLYDQEQYHTLAKEPYVVAVPYKESDEVPIGPFTITFCKTTHPVPCFAIKIELDGQKVVYSADSSYFPELAEFARGADLFICESSFFAGQTASTFGHMNSTEAAKLATEASVNHLLLTHFPHFGDTHDLLIDAKKHYKGNVDLAALGWNLKL